MSTAAPARAYPPARYPPVWQTGQHEALTPWKGGGWLFALLYCLALAGYPLAAAVTTVLEYESSTISYVFRGLVVLLCLIMFMIALGRNRLSPFPLALGLFLSLYLVRLLVDNFVRGLYEADYALLFFLGINLAPAVALTCAATFYDERKTAIVMVLVAGAGVVSILALNNLGVAPEASYFEETRRLSFSALNAITVGYTGLFAIIGSVALWPRANVWVRLLLVLLILFAGTAMVQSASRGPIVAAFACVAAIALVKRKWYIFALFLAAAAYGAVYASTSDFALVERFQNLAADRSANDRLAIQASSIEQALASPVLGHAYAETISYFYPHNLLIESALAMGMGGLALMLYLQIRLLLMAMELLRRGQLLLPLMLLSAIVNANLSAALWSAPEFWINGGMTFVLLDILRRRDRLIARGAAHLPAQQPAFTAGTPARAT